jgi:hypothetical protein
MTESSFLIPTGPQVARVGPLAESLAGSLLVDPAQATTEYLRVKAGVEPPPALNVLVRGGDGDDGDDGGAGGGDDGDDDDADDNDDGDGVDADDDGCGDGGGDDAVVTDAAADVPGGGARGAIRPHEPAPSRRPPYKVRIRVIYHLETLADHGQRLANRSEYQRMELMMMGKPMMIIMIRVMTSDDDDDHDDVR